LNVKKRKQERAKEKEEKKCHIRALVWPNFNTKQKLATKSKCKTTKISINLKRNIGRKKERKEKKERIARRHL